MRRRSVLLAIGILIGTLILTTTVPAHAANRVRLYKGETSQGQRIAFRVAKTDAGRSVALMFLSVTLTCEDATTQEWGFGWDFGNTGSVPITDGAFSYDQVDQFMAAHFEGMLGPLRGEGTVSIAVPALSTDEQAMLCTTGDLTWEVEFVRYITPARCSCRFRRAHGLACADATRRSSSS